MPDNAGTLEGNLVLVAGVVPGRPLVGTIQITLGGNNPAVPARTWSVTTDRAGHFQTSLPAGSYTVVGSSADYARGKGQCFPIRPTAVPVSREQITTITVICDGG